VLSVVWVLVAPMRRVLVNGSILFPSLEFLLHNPQILSISGLQSLPIPFHLRCFATSISVGVLKKRFPTFFTAKSIIGVKGEEPHFFTLFAHPDPRYFAAREESKARTHNLTFFGRAAVIQSLFRVRSHDAVMTYPSTLKGRESCIELQLPDYLLHDAH
jgi:hypothetical protein